MSNKRRQEGLKAYQGDVLTDNIMDLINFSDIGNVLAVTPNDEVNSLASLHFKSIISDQHIFQLAQPGETDIADDAPAQLGGRTLFGTDITYDNLSLRFNTGAGLYAIEIHDLEEFKKKLQSLVPLFVITTDKQLMVWTAINPRPYKWDKPYLACSILLMKTLLTLARQPLHPCPVS